MKKICLTIHSLQSGGMERVMSELARFFCIKNEVEVHLVLYGRNPEFFYNVPGNMIIHKPGSKFNNRFRQISLIRRLLFLRRKIVEINPDSILSFGEYWNNFVLLALLGLKYSVFVSDRCRPDKHLSILHQFLRRFLYRKSSGIIIQTSKAREFYKSFEKYVPVKVIGNPIREILTDPKAVKENIVLTVGRLIPSKNHDKLIMSFLKLNISGWKLVIIGGDALKMTLLKDLKNMVCELGAEDKIVLTGNRSDVDLFYMKSKIFVLTSESEGFPNVIGEAMSAGLPVVSFDCIAGPSELITDGKDGFLIPISDYSQLEQKLEILMNNADLRDQIGHEALRSIKKFSVEVIGEKFYSFIMSDKRK
jgi:GalNAc-alpha-(1->4)-GalNAc-alpha-(1->3)-diNAcBac-PP-undecaprenol alpha-1,4-N-acetyl-D-galactosaminyltransferase